MGETKSKEESVEAHEAPLSDTDIHCEATIVFGDDHGDNDCTFHCKLEPHHIGKHAEFGDQYDKPYRLEWEDKIPT